MVWQGLERVLEQGSRLSAVRLHAFYALGFLALIFLALLLLQPLIYGRCGCAPHDWLRLEFKRNAAALAPCMDEPLKPPKGSQIVAARDTPGPQPIPPNDPFRGWWVGLCFRGYRPMLSHAASTLGYQPSSPRDGFDC